ncbi:hypothetical protein [Sutcliffiella rhizosphaerae]|uniref:Alpha/beta hydrolase n=1 Tax=Sutcliffiella rhizosphaerae TaxID=2880967 RepID=A0ABN8AKN5_9BACI|nr:hypothetical protein [Sutcliffiella rhizosphaerae]CAG9623455.1 hypothetical protein BACCIP111883_04268 [Sutcliffiella rhizosphaerae]
MIVMKLNQRFFQMSGQWNAVHVPEKPNGFGCLIIGDTNHFVDESNSLWLQHIGRNKIMEEILQCGYTLFYSNLNGAHWGSRQSVFQAKQLYHIILKQEILNNKIHILAEGMGALTAMQLMEDMDENIRSVALINPCIDLKAQMLQEKDRKFFYKKVKHEISDAYGLSIKDMEMFEGLPEIKKYKKNKLPVKIWQTTTNFTFDPKLHCRKYEEFRRKQNAPISVTYHLVEKRYTYGPSICQFFKKHEHDL